MKEVLIMLRVGLFSLLLLIYSCNSNEPSEPHEGPIIVGQSPVEFVQITAGDTLNVQFTFRDKQDIEYMDAEFIRRRILRNRGQELWRKSYHYQAYYDLSVGDTILFSYIIPDTVSFNTFSNPDDEYDIVEDVILTKTHYKKSDLHKEFSVNILNK